MPPTNNDDIIVPMHNREPINFNAIQDTEKAPEAGEEGGEDLINEKD
jgi:hypothetical protein